MKRFYILIIILCATIQVCQAQLTRTASFIANDPGVYPISGDVTVTFNSSTMTVNFASNFQTVQGLVLEVFLTKTKNLNLATDIKISTTPLDMGTATGSPVVGARIFNVPAGVNLYEFNNVIIQCTSINELWGHANLCKPAENFTTGPLPSDMYQAVQNIQCSAGTANNSIVTMDATNCIELLMGFETGVMSDFTAEVGPMLGCLIEN